jgi:hypothetical protein
MIRLDDVLYAAAGNGQNFLRYPGSHGAGSLVEVMTVCLGFLTVAMVAAGLLWD